MKNVKIKKTNKNNDLVKHAQSQEEFDQFMTWVANQVQDEIELNLDSMLSDLESAILSDQKTSKIVNNNK